MKRLLFVLCLIAIAFVGASLVSAADVDGASDAPALTVDNHNSTIDKSVYIDGLRKRFTDNLDVNPRFGINDPAILRPDPLGLPFPTRPSLE